MILKMDMTNNSGTDLQLSSNGEQCSNQLLALSYVFGSETGGANVEEGCVALGRDGPREESFSVPGWTKQ